MDKKIHSLLIVVLILIGGFFAYRLNSKAPAENEEMAMNNALAIVNDQASESDIVPATGEQNGEYKEFTVEGGNFKFTPSVMKVNQGDKVRIIFKNVEGFHDFRIDEFNVATQKIKGGAQETLEFTADKTGSFEYYCSVGSHRAMGMKGTFIVE